MTTSDEPPPNAELSDTLVGQGTLSPATIEGPQRRVFIARHGERLDFVDGNYRDTEEGIAYPDDPPLTARGEQQASSISDYLSTYARVTSVYASPFRRCARTATLAAPHLTVRIEPGLCERLSMVRYYQTEKGPIWRQFSQLKEVDINVDDSYQSVNPYDFNFRAYPESTEALNERCERTIRKIIESDETDGDILVVGHISSVKALINSLCPNSIVYKQVPYCCVTECKPDESRPGQYQIVDLCSNAFQSDEIKAASVSELSGGFGRTKYIMMMVGGLVHSFVNAKRVTKREA